MKKKLFIFLILSGIGIKMQGISDTLAFNAGKIILSFGYGYPNIDKWAFDNYFLYNRNNTYKSMGLGPFHFRAEYGLSNKIGIGISLNYNTYGGTWRENYASNNGLGYIQQGTYNFNKKIYSLTGLIRFNYHVFTTKKLDPYFAFGAGFKTIQKSFSSDAPDYVNSYYDNNQNDYGISDLPAAFEAVAGMRYYFTPHIGIYSEIGIAKSLVQAGISIGF